MNTRRWSFDARAAIVSAAALLLAGCSTIESRIARHEALFAGLAPERQEQILRGEVDLGFTPEMVYLALGEPSAKRRGAAGGLETMTWTYNRYSSVYAGERISGYRQVAYIDPVTKTQRTLLEPIYSSAYRQIAEPNLRVIFRDGRVYAIEQRVR